jgi:hypothetical protein
LFNNKTHTVSKRSEAPYWQRATLATPPKKQKQTNNRFHQLLLFDIRRIDVLMVESRTPTGKKRKVRYCFKKHAKNCFKLHQNVKNATGHG